MAGWNLLNETADAKRSGYKLHDWTGDDFKVGHSLRDGKLPKEPKHAEKKYDVVILGGGLAGLACANYLQDRDFILLEQYDDLGGQSRGSTYRGIDYSYGSAYYNDDDGGNLTSLVSDLKLVPSVVNESDTTWYFQNKFIDYKSNKDHIFFKELIRLKEEVTKVNSLIGPRLLDSYRQDNQLKKLDETKMESYLTGYDPDFVQLLDSYFKSSLCGGAKRISALSGLYLMDDLFSDCSVLPGGNQAIVKALVNRLKQTNLESLKASSFVWSVELKENGASIVYSDNKNRVQKVDCDHLIIAIPHMVAARVLQNLEDKTKSQLFRFRYGSYLVANLLLNKQVYDKAYDSWFAGPIDFADIILADTPYLKTRSTEGKLEGSVLSVYQPYEPASIGRTLLFKGDKKTLSKNLVEQVSKLIPDVEGALEEVVLSRWGHALAVPMPGYYKQLDTLQSLEGSSYSFAHSSSQCIPSVEAAVDAARRVADKINGKKLGAAKSYFTSRIEA